MNPLLSLVLSSILLAFSPQLPSLDKAIALFDKGFYAAAQGLFEDYLDRAARLRTAEEGPADRHREALAATYWLRCRLAAGDEEAPAQVANWEARWPWAPGQSQVYAALGAFLFDRGRYAEAGEALARVDLGRVERARRGGLRFRQAYCAFEAGDEERALQLFETVDRWPGAVYTHLALYYQAYIQYKNQRFDKALPLWERLRDIPQYASLAPLYILQSRYYLGQYKEVVRQGEDLYLSAPTAQKATVAKLVSEAWLALGDKKQALVFFERYRNQGGEESREDLYYSGMLHYGLGDYEAAAQNLGRAAADDSLGQNALYHLGEARIRLGNKKAALEAFYRASQMGFDPSIEEDAFFNYAKLAFDLQGQTEAIAAYQSRWANPAKHDELNTYMATAYLLDKEYQAAIRALQALSTPTEENRRTLQRACLLRGLELYKAGSYRQCREHFDQAMALEALHPATAALARYWSAHALYQEGDYAGAARTWTAFMQSGGKEAFPQLYSRAVLNRAYACFEQADWVLAQEGFEAYLQDPKALPTLRADACLRLGDCAFMQRDYATAEARYQMAMDAQSPRADYALYQMALGQGILNQETDKIETLDRLLREQPQSPLYTSALFEQARTYVQLARYEEAAARLRTLSENEDHAHFRAKALLELGLIALNLHQEEEALSRYKAVLEQYPSAPEAADALAGIEHIYQSQNNTAEFFAYLRGLGLETGKSEDEKEALVFASAEQRFLQGEHERAVKDLEQFLKLYPQSEKRNAALFYMAESLQRSGKREQAAKAYLQVMEAGDGAYSEIASLQYAHIQYALEDFAEAANAYRNLYEIAQLENNKKAAMVGLMRSGFKIKDYKTALNEARRITLEKDFDADILREARYVSALSYLALGAHEQALALLGPLSKETEYKEGAEAAFLLCKDAFDSGDYSRAETLVYAFSDSNSPHEYWMARAFILLGDVYARQGEHKQARATYQSVLEGYSPQEADDIAHLVGLRIQELDQKNL